jgi:ATP/maltotriose-dependent transcriptional regulator MalT
MDHPQTFSPSLIGRDEPLQPLEGQLARAERGQGRFVLLSGDAGVGKTRLVSEFLRRAQRAEVLVGHCYEEAPAMPYRPVIEALGTWSRRGGPASVAAMAGPWVEDVGRLIPELAPGRRAIVAEGDDPGMKWRLFEGVAQLLRAVQAEDLERALESSPVGRLAALTPREREVLVLLARGLSNRQISQELVIAVKTVEIHVSNVLSKLDLKSRSAAAALAAEEGLMTGGGR